jgi:3-oxoacyl-[acyl-carrier-protein] synthase III
MIAVRNGVRGRARLAAMGAHVPERVLTNADLEKIVDTTDEWIFSRTGIRERRVAPDDQATSDLATAAARAILADAGVDAADLDVLIVPTCTPDHLFPSVAAITANAIGAHTAAAFDLQAACSGFVYGLAQGTGLIESGLARNVLIVGAETMTRVTDPTDRATCILFGDAAAGALLVRGDEETTGGLLGFELGADGSGCDQLILPVGGTRHPPWAPFERKDAYLQMNGREVFRFATRVMEDSATRLLESLEMDIGEVDLLIAHQANQRIIDHAVKRLGIDERKVFNNLDRYGNTSSASIPLAMVEARDQGYLKPGDLMLLVGFGAGLTWGSALVRYEPVVAEQPA